MTPRLRKVRSRAAALIAAVGTGLVLANPVAAATIPRPEGAGPPVAASGMGTQAALDNPACRVDETTGPYGRFDGVQEGTGPVCVKEWKGKDNGGSTAQGVTKNRIKIVALIPNEQQMGTEPQPPRKVSDNSKSNYQDGIYDFMLPQMKYYETWGRDIELVFHTSTGDDEAAQRADLVAIKNEEPFAALMFWQTPSSNVMETGLAKAGIVVYGYRATPSESNAQAPYRWNASDTEAPAIATAEVLGKQVVGEKAEFGGEDVNGKPRKLGVIYLTNTIDPDAFKQRLKKYGGKDGVVTQTIEFTPSTDATQNAALATTILTKMQNAGVTTIVNFTGNVKDLMEAADKQSYTPEWVLSGSNFSDIGVLMRSYPKTQ